MIAYEFEVIPKSLFVFILTILLLLWLLNMEWLDRKVSLIKRYNSLMKSLYEYSITQEIEASMKDWNPDSPQSHVDAIKYFNKKKTDIDTKYNNLHNKLSKIIGIRYYLLVINSNQIGIDFVEIVSDTKELYEYFGRAINKEFVLELKISRSEYIELKNTFPENMLLNMLSRAEWKNTYAGV